mmetsp:Transcript_18773/g.55046  ORF Transcript_18773/g.55046 Transcript_18773/m.55046 type:complete len:310 (-) Transcript_18773:1092-2021(-)
MQHATRVGDDGGLIPAYFSNSCALLTTGPLFLLKPKGKRPLEEPDRDGDGDGVYKVRARDRGPDEPDGPRRPVCERCFSSRQLLSSAARQATAETVGRKAPLSSLPASKKLKVAHAKYEDAVARCERLKPNIKAAKVKGDDGVVIRVRAGEEEGIKLNQGPGVQRMRFEEVSAAELESFKECARGGRQARELVRVAVGAHIGEGVHQLELGPGCLKWPNTHAHSLEDGLHGSVDAACSRVLLELAQPVCMRRYTIEPPMWVMRVLSKMSSTKTASCSSMLSADGASRRSTAAFVPHEASEALCRSVVSA